MACPQFFDTSLNINRNVQHLIDRLHKRDPSLHLAPTEEGEEDKHNQIGKSKHPYIKHSIEDELNKQTDRNKIRTEKMTKAKNNIKVFRTKVKQKCKKIEAVFFRIIEKKGDRFGEIRTISVKFKSRQ